MTGKRRSDVNPLGVGEGVEDGEAHIGDGDLREDGAVDELDQGVNGGLGMNGDADLGAGGRSKRRQASMISKPLFIMVAESMVMRWPMTQVGCFRA